MTVAGGPRTPPRGRQIDHVGIAVPDLDAGATPWLAFGLPVEEDEALPSQGVVVRLLRAGDGFVELLAPLRADTPVGRFLASRGPGLHHVAFRVGDVAAELERLRGEGARLIDETPRPGRGGSRVAFVHPGWAGGTLIELVQPG